MIARKRRYFTMTMPPDGQGAAMREELPELPQNLDAERSVLCALLSKPGDSATALQLAVSDFYSQPHRLIYKTIKKRILADEPVDIVAVMDELGGDLEAAGGAAYLASLMDPLNIADVTNCAHIIREKANLRELANLGEQALSANGNAGQLFERVKILSTNLERKDSAEPSSFRELFDSYEELLTAPPLTFAIRDFLQNDGITMIGGLPGHGKTLVMLSMAKALLTGKPLWNHFPVEEKAVRVVYLIPECARGPFAHRLKLFGLLPFAAPDDERLLVRTLSKGPAPHLDDPRILSAVKGAHVFLDTAIRFTDGRDENSAAENQLLAKDLFALLAAGARSVTGAHHSPKAFGRDNTMSLENVLRGSGDIGAILATCFGLKQIDKDQNIIHVENVKPRDFTPPLPFQLIGRPNLDETGDLVMLKKPGECGSLAEEQPENPANENKHREKTDRVAIVASWLKDDPDMPASDIAEKFKAMGIQVDRSTASRYRKNVRGNSR